jgi:hypothetical protein
MPIILATQEAEIRKIVVGSQPRQIVHETPHLQKKEVAQGVALSSNPNTTKKNLTFYLILSGS